MYANVLLDRLLGAIEVFTIKKDYIARLNITSPAQFQMVTVLSNSTSLFIRGGPKVILHIKHFFDFFAHSYIM